MILSKCPVPASSSSSHLGPWTRTVAGLLPRQRTQRRTTHITNAYDNMPARAVPTPSYRLLSPSQALRLPAAAGQDGLLQTLGRTSRACHAPQAAGRWDVARSGRWCRYGSGMPARRLSAVARPPLATRRIPYCHGAVSTTDIATLRPRKTFFMATTFARNTHARPVNGEHMDVCDISTQLGRYRAGS